MPRHNHNAGSRPEPRSRIADQWRSLPSKHVFLDGYRPRPDYIEFPSVVAVEHPRRVFAGHPDHVPSPREQSARVERFEMKRRAVASQPVGDAARARARAGEGRAVSWADGLAFLREELSGEEAAA